MSATERASYREAQSRIQMRSDPVLGKRDPEPRDHRWIQWVHVLRLRLWALDAATKHGCSVYIVGSALNDAAPRDLDVAFVWPAQRFAELFGSIPDEGGTLAMREYLCYAIGRSDLWGELFNGAHMATDDYYTLDIHLCPDTWWVDHPRLQIA